MTQNPLVKFWQKITTKRTLARQPQESVGLYGERVAADYLSRLGYRIVSRNERNAVGEIDIIAILLKPLPRRIVFVEVKTWTHEENGSGPSDAVDDHKQNQVTNAALYYLRTKRLLEHPVRFDVIAVNLVGAEEVPRIRHFQGAFEATVASKCCDSRYQIQPVYQTFAKKMRSTLPRSTSLPNSTALSSLQPRSITKSDANTFANIRRYIANFG